MKPTLEEVKLLAKNYTMIPLSLELLADVRTPIQILKILLRCMNTLEDILKLNSK